MLTIEDRDITFKEIAEDSHVQGTIEKKEKTGLFSARNVLVQHTYIFTERKCEILLKGKATGLYWGLQPLLDGRPMSFGEQSIDMNLIKNAIRCRAAEEPYEQG